MSCAAAVLTQWPTTCRTRLKLGSTVRADDVAALALHDGRQGIVEADGTFKQ